MISIRYNNRNGFEDVNFTRNGNLVTMTPTTPHTSGFTTWKLDRKTQLGDFSDFTTVYKVYGESVTYSNDGSVYVEPPKPTEEELRRQALQTEKTELEAWLKAHDYIGVKIATGRRLRRRDSIDDGEGGADKRDRSHVKLIIQGE